MTELLLFQGKTQLLEAGTNCELLFDLLQLRDFTKAGAIKGDDPKHVVESCDITFTCVADSVAVRDVSLFLFSFTG